MRPPRFAAIARLRAAAFQLYPGRIETIETFRTASRRNPETELRHALPETHPSKETRDMAQIRVNDAVLHFRESGAGVPVVALHGSASSGAQWRSLAGHLEGRFRVITPDLPGYGGSEAAKGRALGLGGDAGQIIGLLATLGEPAHLVGHSFGGAVALKIARLRPDLVRSLTLIEPAAFHLLRGAGRDEQALADMIGALARLIADAARAGRRDAAIAAFVDFWNGAGAWGRTSEGLRASLAGSLDAVLANFAAIAWERDRLADHARTDLPTLAAFGLESRPVAMRVTEMIAETLPQAALRMIPEAGHMAPLTDPHVVDPMIAAHLVAVDRVRSVQRAQAA
jgi:lipase